MTLDEFLDWYPDGYGHYELHNGIVFEIQPTGTHEQVAGFIALKLGVQIELLQLPYIIPRQAIVKPIDTDKYDYNPDVIVLDKSALKDEYLWKKRSTITLGKTVKLIIEVVSTNWRDDYGHKLIDYDKLEIPEYWIVDYLGLGGKRYIGDPKQPTLSIYQLIDGEYQVQQFRGDEKIISPTFPELKLTAQQIFIVGG
ncbi:MAG: Uma2 family endonuclease [Okeania sp. SIO3C4]|nr:Uma2 family endonuclease [Okeania sp. SIO3B3]NER08251.1 Uma2 family endonuclease [Okeania sp. SIO3C4]